MFVRLKVRHLPVILLVSLIPLHAFSQEPDYIALVTDIQGNVQVKSPDQTGMRKCMWGTQLHNGDNIQTQTDGRVSLLFSNGNLISLGPSSAMTISSGPASSGNGGESIGNIDTELAADLSTIIVQRDEEGGFDALAGLRSGEAGSEIVLLGPGNTAVADTRPAFQWTSKKTFESYTVTLFSSEGPVWSKETEKTALEYPEQEESLVCGQSYFWMVEGEDLLDNVPSRRAGFTILSKKQTDEVDQYKAKIGEMFGNETDVTSYHTIVGAYYEKAGLLRDAIIEFKAIAKLNPESPLPHEILGRLYKRIGRKDQAIAELQKALKLSKSQE